MKKKLLTYDGERISVAYDVARCIHAAECVKGLPEVFDPNRKPWVDANAAEPERILEVVSRCPTGALAARSADGSVSESAPEQNTVTVAADGPLYLRGRLAVTEPDGSVHEDTRLALCRCGASNNKPYCDGRHAEAGFNDTGALGKFAGKPAAADGPLKVNLAPNGPLLTAGPMEISDAAGSASVSCGNSALCRCGVSKNKPYCDGGHKAAGFTAN